MGMFRKKKDEVSKKRDQQAQVPYRKCGKSRRQKMPNGSVVTVYCTKNGNLPHSC